MTDPAIVLHGTALSGHTHRVELLLRILELPYRFVPAPAEVRRSAAFSKLNPLRQIPVLEDGELVLADSNAIMVYLVKRYAPGSSWLPNEPVAASNVQRWLSIAAGEVMYGPATARMVAQFGMEGDPVRSVLIAGRLLSFMDAHLEDRNYLAAAHPTLADLACYSYVAHAPEAGIGLDAYEQVRAWLRRVEALPRFKAMPAREFPRPPEGRGLGVALSAVPSPGTEAR
ncbi:glutathione S-transferase [Rhizobiales bacterium GAS188]|nr:glutathione S-transferase [Rhizobiales bacterium GAS188]